MPGLSEAVTKALIISPDGDSESRGPASVPPGDRSPIILSTATQLSDAKLIYAGTLHWATSFLPMLAREPAKLLSSLPVDALPGLLSQRGHCLITCPSMYKTERSPVRNIRISAAEPMNR